MKLLWLVVLVVGTVRADDDEKKDSVGTVIGIDLGTTYSWYYGIKSHSKFQMPFEIFLFFSSLIPRRVLKTNLSLIFSVGVFKNGRVEIIANDQGNRITPSYVAFTSEGERLIGDAAKNQLTSNPENTVFDAKRLIGRTWGDSSVQQDIKYLPFKVSYNS